MTGRQQGGQRLTTRRVLLYGGTAALAAGGAAWWLAGPGDAAVGEVTTDAIGDRVQTLPRGQLPVFATTADTRRLYRYAVEHGEHLQSIPCFCGCGRFGHRDNRDCYIKSASADGTITFTSHAAT